MESNVYKKLTDKFPFLTLAKYMDEEYIGIIQNMDQQCVSMYILSDIFDPEEKKEFLRLGEVWWWESNRQIPINVFLKDQFGPFRRYLKTFAKKEFEVICGPTVSLQDNMQKRIKRRQIQLVRKYDG
jgi:hypothetical protein